MEGAMRPYGSSVKIDEEGQVLHRADLMVSILKWGGISFSIAIAAALSGVIVWLTQ
jgi:hypothetical protein